MIFCQVFLLSPLHCTVTCMSLKKQKSQGKAVEVSVNIARRKTLMTFVCISSKKFSNVKNERTNVPLSFWKRSQNVLVSFPNLSC
jgi:hypothetical protein